jgi:Family of unknown function (DUF6491)
MEVPVRRLFTIFALALGAGAAIAATASASAFTDDALQRSSSRRGNQCFNARMVTGFRSVNRDQVDITAPGRRTFRLDLGPGCFDINWSDRIALISRTGSFVCGPLDAEIVSRGGPIRSHCYVTGMRQLSDEEVAASRMRRH